MSEPLARFDGATLWATLSQDVQAQIGAAALELTCGYLVQDEVHARMVDGSLDQGKPWDRAADHFADLCVLGDRLDIVVLETASLGALLRDADGRPLLPLGFGRICRGCGCSQDDACEPSCSWVEDDLCSVCGGVEP